MNCIKALVIAMGIGLMPYLAAASETRVFEVEEGKKISLSPIVDGLGVVWGLTFISPHQLIATERDGAIRLVDSATGMTTMVEGGPSVLAAGQGGLLDVAVEPSYRPGGWIYFTYVKEVDGRGVTALGRARLRGDRLHDWSDLVVTRSATDTSKHFGSRIAFDSQGHVFFSVGDRGVRPNGQDLATHAGSILRVNLDGSVPPDNPFVKTNKALPQIWSYGHRNIQGMVYDHEGNRLWAIEHGPRGGDELNLIRPGLNYGWPVVSHGKEYWGPKRVGEATEKEGMEPAVKVYIPSIAPGSLILYRGSSFPWLRSSLLAGALAGRHVNRIMLDEQGEAVGEQRWFAALNERIRSLAVSFEGLLFLGTDSGRIYRGAPAE